MSPNKSIEAQICDSIDNDIFYQEHERDAKEEQLWLAMEKEIDEQEDRANDYD